jgi:hypothetical protein
MQKGISANKDHLTLKYWKSHKIYVKYTLQNIVSLPRPPTITLPHLSHVIRLDDVAFFVVGRIYEIFEDK